MIVGAATVLGAIFGGLSCFFPRSAEDPVTESMTSTPATAPVASAATRSEPPAPVQADDESPSLGTCLMDPADPGSAVACDTAHAAEVIADGGDCSEATAVEYAGGAVGTDLFSGVVQTRAVDDSCILSLDGSPAEASIRDAFPSGRADGLRECWNGRARSLVPCSEDHTGEIVARVPAASTDSLDCEVAAGEYLEQDIAERFAQLTVEEISSEAARRCVVSPRSDGVWLRTPLRGLGDGDVETAGF